MIIEWLNGLTTLLSPYTDLIGVFAAIVTAVIAVVALRSTANDSRERSRPQVLAVFRGAEHSETAFELVVRNHGLSSAKDLRVTFDPPLSDDLRKNKIVDLLSRRYAEPIPLLPPNAELTNTWWSGENVGANELENRLKTPDEVVVSVSYKGNRWRRYQDAFTLHADSIKFTTYNVSSTSMPGRMESITKSLSALVGGIKDTNGTLKTLAAKDKK